MDRNPRYRFGIVWALVVVVVLLAAGCTGSRRAVPKSRSVATANPTTADPAAADPCSAPDMRRLGVDLH